MPRFKRGFRFISIETRGMHEAAYLLAIFAFGSQILGLVRDRLLAAEFGASHTIDLYYAAFRVPDFLFATVASLFSLYALLPVLSRLEAEKKGLMTSFLRDALWVFLAGMAVISLILFFLVPVLAPLVAPGFVDAASRADLILLMRILLLQPVLLGLSNTVAALTQMRHRFLLYSVSPLLYNLGIIFGAIVLYPHFGIVGLGFGVILGAFFHMAIQMPFFFAEKPDGAIERVRLWRLIREILTLSVPRTLALASTQISLVAIVAMASLLSSGSIAIFTFAYNLQSVPLTIIGVSYAVAAFPVFARLHATGKKEEFSRYIEAALRHVIFWSIPATVFVIVLRAQIVRTILGSGHFNWSDTRLTAAALALFILSLLAQSASLLVARAYYAVGNTKKPFYFGCADVVVSILSALLLVSLFHGNLFVRDLVESILRVDDLAGTSVLMLALGYALGSIAEFIVGYVYFVRDFNLSHAHLRSLVFQSFSASVIGGAASYAVLSATGALGTINTTIGIFLQGLYAGIVGIIVALIILALLKNKELFEAVAALKRKFVDTPAVAVEPSDVA